MLSIATNVPLNLKMDGINKISMSTLTSSWTIVYFVPLCGDFKMAIVLDTNESNDDGGDNGGIDEGCGLV